jgi:hypothetical protein
LTRTRPLAAGDIARARRDVRFREASRCRPPEPGWRSRGLCLRHDPEVFFPETLEDPTPALAICGCCPVRGACLATALDVGECDGVWGGTTPRERRFMRAAWSERQVASAATGR